jgi:8-oxo-dGTP pyrophosphatase MutT (NUDIX family)
MKSQGFSRFLRVKIVDNIEATRSGQNSMKRVSYVSIILENAEGEVLLLLRDNKSTPVFPNHWTLIGGKVENGETPETAARRQLEEETGLKTDLSFWKRYDREHPLFIIDQHIFTGRVENPQEMLVLGRDTQFIGRCEIEHLKIGYGFKNVLHEYFSAKGL